ncbi:mitochondrial K+-H+ exchange-related-domain-containing protein [Mycena vitilis]|nr:mitochondrial K+-H+ exchange-related-domain-containing protein [Mycena vitilis]
MTTTASRMRIIALPLVRRGGANAKLPIFYSWKIISLPQKKNGPPPGFFSRWGGWASLKANETWTGFGAAPDGTFKKRAFQLGERLMDRVEFEESNLKALYVPNAPPLEAKGKVVALDTIPLLYPPTILSGPQSLAQLKALAVERSPLHFKAALMWAFYAVLTAPLKLIPIIPNFPFYFCAWRTWHHLRAMRAARYLQGLVLSNRIVPTPLSELNEVYAKLEGVISREALERAARELALTPEEHREVLRAHDQVLLRDQKGKKAD